MENLEANTDEGSSETVTKYNGLKMLAPDGRMRITDTADTQIMLRIVQSVPSPNDEPFKLCLALARLTKKPVMAN